MENTEKRQETKIQRLKKWLVSRSKKQKIFLTVALVIVVLLMILGIVFVSLRSQGKKNLYGRTAGLKPVLGMETSKTDADEKVSETDTPETKVQESDEQREDIPESVVENEERETQPSTTEYVTKKNQAVSENSQEHKTTEMIPANLQAGKTLEIIDEDGEGGYELEEQPETTVPDYVEPAKDATYDLLYKGEKYAYNTDILTFLILGIDKRTEVEQAKDGISGGQSDALFLLVLNPHTKIMDIITIPRDTIALVDIYDRAGNYTMSGYTQICLQHGYGDGMSISNERAKNAVSNLFYQLPIHSVTSINMGAIPGINDAVGGITLDSLYTFSDEGWNFVKGQSVHLQGVGAYSYIHYRDTSRHYTAPERLERQKQYITLFVDTALQKIRKNPSAIVNVYSAVQQYVVTDLTVPDMTYLASEIAGYKFGEIRSLEGRVDTSRKYERFYTDNTALYDLIIEKFYEKAE